ncbi:MAG: toprim domain-containing protein [Fusobacterium varium]|uniref:toprim domain-containing protein n=1 Tax=Fusobacterium varium TaxID=856 RepID=UPI00242E214F|nr:toprim domain-containing protein [Fusobacterium varium]UYI78524.1 MAG: toprim domain-containing protein [Fusobacterium varium]
MDKFEKYKIYGEELRFDFCPICNKEKKENPCFSVNIKTGNYICHTTGKGGNIKDLEDFNPEILENIKPQSSKKEKEKVDFKYLVDNSNSLNDEWTQYLKSRGISEKGLNRFCRLGKNNTMMIPITDGEKVVAIKYRTIDKKISSEKGSTSDYFINWQNTKDKSYLIIVEGEIDLLSAVEAGYLNVVSLPFGAKNLKCIDNQKEWIESFSKIIIATDNDVAGKESQEKIIKKLKTVSSKIYLVDYKNFKDFNEILMSEGIEGIKNIINNASQLRPKESPFSIREDAYYIFQREDYVRLTDFLISDFGYSDNYIKGISKIDNRERPFIAKRVDLLTVKGILEHVGSYMGSSQSILKFWTWLIEKNKEKYIPEIMHYGIIDNVYYDEDSNVICPRKDLKIQRINNIEPLTASEKAWLDTNLIYLRSDPNQSLLGICWALGRFHIHESYPILEVSGTTSIGKTEYAEFISRILFGGKENIKSFSTLSNHQIRSFCSSSNITSLVIDEVKITNKISKINGELLFSTIRSVYDNKKIEQGNTTEKLTEFKLCTPLMISGESELSDVSLKNRMISTELNRKNKSSDEVFFKLKDTNLLEKLGKKALEERLSKGKIEISRQELREFLSKVDDERQLYNGKCILVGLIALKNIISIDEKIIHDFVKYLNEKLSTTYNVISNFLELLKLVLDREDIHTFYRNDENGHYARFQLLYKAIAEEHFRTNSTLELLDMKALRKQLIEEEFIIENNINQRFLVGILIDEKKPLNEVNSIVKKCCKFKRIYY